MWMTSALIQASSLRFKIWEGDQVHINVRLNLLDILLLTNRFLKHRPWLEFILLTQWGIDLWSYHSLKTDTFSIIVALNESLLHLGQRYVSGELASASHHSFGDTIYLDGRSHKDGFQPQRPIDCTNTLTEDTRPEGEMGCCRISLINISITANVNTYVMIQRHYFVTMQFEEMAAAGWFQHVMLFVLCLLLMSLHVDVRKMKNASLADVLLCRFIVLFFTVGKRI